MKKLIIFLLLLYSLSCIAQKQIYLIKDTTFTKNNDLSIKYLDNKLSILDNTDKRQVIDSYLTYVGSKVNCKYYLDQFQNRISMNYDSKKRLYCIIIEAKEGYNFLIIYP